MPPADPQSAVPSPQSKVRKLPLYKNDHLSVSRLKLYETCPRSFFFRYVSKGPTMPGNAGAAFGKVIHAALERLFLWAVERKFRGLVAPEEALRHFRDAWEKGAPVDPLDPDDREELPELRSVAVYTEALEVYRRYLRVNPYIDSGDVLAIEDRFDLSLGDGLSAVGYLDRVDRIDARTIVIVDYKSNRKLFTRDELESDLQMSTYGLVARQKWPWAERIFYRFDMVRHGISQPVERTRSQVDDARDYVVALGKRIETDDTWEARINENCCYCEHRRRCDAYAEHLGIEASAKRPLPTDLPGLVAERDRVEKLAKSAYARKKEIDELLEGHMKNTDELAVDGYLLRWASRTNVSYPAERTINKLRALGLSDDDIRNTMHVSKDEIEKLLERIEANRDLPRSRALLLRAEIEACGTAEPSSPWVETRKLKTTKGAKDVR